MAVGLGHGVLLHILFASYFVVVVFLAVAVDGMVNRRNPDVVSTKPEFLEVQRLNTAISQFFQTYRMLLHLT